MGPSAFRTVRGEGSNPSSLRTGLGPVRLQFVAPTAPPCEPTHRLSGGVTQKGRNVSDGFAAGDLVEIRDYGIGIVTEPIAKDSPGHVLTVRDGAVVGLEAALRETTPAGPDSTGFVQLAHQLIRLGSYVIEERLIVYRT